jgi:tetratricopeptide (TPR) repeat protein
VWTARRIASAVRRGPPWVVGLGAGVLAYAVQQLFLFPLAELDPAVWLLAGLLAARAPLAEPGTGASRQARPAVAVGAAVAAIALVAGWRDVVADRAAKRSLAALGRGQLATAGRAAQRATDQRPDVIRYRLVAAGADRAQATPAGFEAALKDLDRALDVSPRDPVVRGERGRVLIDAGRFAEARAWMEDLVADDPLNAEWQLRLGVAAARVGKLPEAERAWTAAEDLDPRSPAPAINLATAYADAGRWTEARAAARRAIQRDPTNQQAADLLQLARRHGT